MIEVFQPPRITREETAYKMLFHVLRLCSIGGFHGWVVLFHGWRFPKEPGCAA